MDLVLYEFSHWEDILMKDKIIMTWNDNLLNVGMVKWSVTLFCFVFMMSNKLFGNVKISID